MTFELAMLKYKLDEERTNKPNQRVKGSIKKYQKQIVKWLKCGDQGSKIPECNVFHNTQQEVMKGIGKDYENLRSIFKPYHACLDKTNPLQEAKVINVLQGVKKEGKKAILTLRIGGSDYDKEIGIALEKRMKKRKKLSEGAIVYANILTNKKTHDPYISKVSTDYAHVDMWAWAKDQKPLLHRLMYDLLKYKTSLQEKAKDMLEKSDSAHLNFTTTSRVKIRRSKTRKDRSKKRLRYLRKKRAALRAAFKEVDEDNTGSIGNRGLKRLLESLGDGDKLTDDGIIAVLGEVPDRITFNEFKALYEQRKKEEARGKQNEDDASEVNPTPSGGGTEKVTKNEVKFTSEHVFSRKDKKPLSLLPGCTLDPHHVGIEGFRNMFEFRRKILKGKSAMWFSEMCHLFNITLQTNPKARRRSV